MKANYFIKEVLFTREEIEARIKELATWVNTTYKKTNCLVLVGLLKGCIPFMAQLIKDLTIPLVIDFMIVASYHGKLRKHGNLKVVMDLNHDVYDHDVLVVEDIIDSGLTLGKVIEKIKSQQPKSLRVLTLLDKTEARVTNLQPDKSGFHVPNKFLVGFGLDVKEKLRNLPYIAVFDETKFDEV